MHIWVELPPLLAPIFQEQHQDAERVLIMFDRVSFGSFGMLNRCVKPGHTCAPLQQTVPLW